jgi:hypothetical protein
MGRRAGRASRLELHPHRFDGLLVGDDSKTNSEYVERVAGSGCWGGASHKTVRFHTIVEAKGAPSPGRFAPALMAWTIGIMFWRSMTFEWFIPALGAQPTPEGLAKRSTGTVVVATPVTA